MSLSSKDCRLVDPILVDRYNALEVEFDEVSARLSNCRGARFSGNCAQLAGSAEVLQRETYRVGFLGLSGGGQVDHPQPCPRQQRAADRKTRSLHQCGDSDPISRRWAIRLHVRSST